MSSPYVIDEPPRLRRRGGTNPSLPHYSLTVPEPEPVEPLLDESEFPPEFFHGPIKQLGQGGYNRVFKPKSFKVVFRVSLVPNEKHNRQKRLLRGDTLLRILNRSPEKFGPSLVKHVRRTFRTTKIPPEMEGENKIDAEKFSYWVQSIEYLPLMPKDIALKDEEEWWFFAFSLLWFFYTAQVEVGLIHRDLKVENVGIRIMKNPKSTVTFTLDESKTFVFYGVSRAPVVFDFDFGVSRYETEEMGIGGTRLWRPPETLLEFNENYYWDYDMYAVGLLLIYFWCKVDVTNYSENILVIASALNEFFNQERYPPQEIYQFRARDEEVSQMLLEISEQLQMLNMEQRRLIGQLINWRPNERSGNGSVYTILENYFGRWVKNNLRGQEKIDFAYAYPRMDQIHSLGKLFSNEDAMLLQCSICSAPAFATCGKCNARPYCSERCASHDWYYKGHCQ